MKKILTILFFYFLMFLSFSYPTYAYESTAGASAILSMYQIDSRHDTRQKVLKEFLASYNSPLTEYANIFIKEADANGIDWRLLVAISGVESTFAQQIPYNSNNAWGWGIYGDNMIVFESYPEAIQTISKSLRENYINKWGAKDVYQIGKFYAASPTWAQRVEYFMSKIDQFAVNNPSFTLSITI